jgi:hypothetical protein
VTVRKTCSAQTEQQFLCCASFQLAQPAVHTQQRPPTTRPRCLLSKWLTISLPLSTILAFSIGLNQAHRAPSTTRASVQPVRGTDYEMPSGGVQALCFMLGLLLSFYLLTPFLDAAVR